MKKILDVLFICHRMPERSFFFKGKQFPICARCTGITCGYLLGIAVLIFLGYIPLLWAVVILLPTIIDGTGQLFKYWESTNSRRFITGILAGIGIDFAIFHILRLGFIHGQELSKYLT